MLKWIIDNNVSIIIFFISMVVASYQYFRPRIIRGKPSYQIAGIELIKSKVGNELPNQIEILYEGKKISGLNKTQISFWNDGAIIEDSNFLPEFPIKIVFEQNTKILRHEILSKSREAIGFKLVDVEGKPNELKIKFRFLDQNDGAIIEILHSGKNLYPEIHGVIKGIPKGIRDKGIINYPIHQPKSKTSFNILKKIIIVTLILIIGMAAFIILNSLVVDATREKTLFTTKWYLNIPALLFVIITFYSYILRFKRSWRRSPNNISK